MRTISGKFLPDTNLCYKLEYKVSKLMNVMCVAYVIKLRKEVAPRLQDVRNEAAASHHSGASAGESLPSRRV